MCHLLLAACFAIARCLQCLRQTGRGRTAVCLLVLYLAFSCVADGVQIHDISGCSSVGLEAARAHVGHDTIRRLPRPLTGRLAEDVARPCGESAGEVASSLRQSHGAAFPGITGGDECSLTTLLDESIARQDSRAFLLASTLLETLTEHFYSDETGSTVDEPCIGSVGVQVGSARALCLDTLIPAQDNGLTVAHGPVAPEQFDLTEGQCALPCGNSLFDSLCCKIDPRFLRGPVHAVDKAWRFREFAAGSPGRSPAPGERLTLTADGSFCPVTGRAGWAVVVGLAAPPDQLGQFVGCIYGPVPEDARRQAVKAYVAEVWGLVMGWCCCAAAPDSWGDTCPG